MSNYDAAIATIRLPTDESVLVTTVMSATAQAQAEATKVAHKDGIAYATQQPEVKYEGRKPSYNREQFEIMRRPQAEATRAAQIAPPIAHPMLDRQSASVR